MAYAVDFLIGLMPFPGDEHHVIRIAQGKRPTDGGAAIGLHNGRVLSESGQDVGDDGRGVFGSGIVGGDDRDVGPTIHGGGHFGPLGAIAVSPAPKNANHAPTGEAAERGEHVGQRVIGMRVVHKNVGRDGFQSAPARTGRGDGTEDGIGADAEGVGGRGGAEEIGEIVTPAKRCPESDRAPPQGDLGLGSGRGERRLERGGGIGKEPGSPLGAQKLQQATTVRVVGIDDGWGLRVFQKEAGLDGEVGLHRAMVVEMVLREIGESGEGETAGPHTRLVDGMAGNLHHRGAAPGRDHVGEGGLERSGIRGGAIGRGIMSGPLHRHRGEQPGEQSPLSQHIAQQPRGRGLAVRSRNAAKQKTLGRSAIEIGARLGKGHPRMFRHDIAPRTGAHHGGRTSGPGLGDITPAVIMRAGNGHEKRPGRHLPGVTDHIRETLLPTHLLPPLHGSLLALKLLTAPPLPQGFLRGGTLAKRLGKLRGRRTGGSVLFRLPTVHRERGSTNDLRLHTQFLEAFALGHRLSEGRLRDIGTLLIGLLLRLHAINVRIHGSPRENLNRLLRNVRFGLARARVDGRHAGLRRGKKAIFVVAAPNHLIGDIAPEFHKFGTIRVTMQANEHRVGGLRVGGFDDFRQIPQRNRLPKNAHFPGGIDVNLRLVGIERAQTGPRGAPGNERAQSQQRQRPPHHQTFAKA